MPCCLDEGGSMRIEKYISKKVIEKYKDYDKYQLIDIYQKTNDKKVKKEVGEYLLYLHLSIIRYAVNKVIGYRNNNYIIHDSGGLSKNDLLISACEYFYNYLERYNPSKNVTFDTYIFFYIKNRVISYIRKASNKEKSFWQHLDKVDEFYQKNRRYPTEKEAKSMGIRSSTYDKIMMYLNSLSLYNKNDFKFLSYETPENSVIEKENKKEINQMIENLPYMSKAIFQMIQSGYTQKEVKKQLNLSKYSFDKWYYHGVNQLKPIMKELSYEIA
jgi:RNA polymerase sigma factor (sigma-70 family)